MESTLEILDKVNSFYSSSFSQLITLTVAILAFSGIVLPLLISYYQNRQLSLQREMLEKSISEHADAIEERLKNNVLEYFSNESDKFEKEIVRLEEKIERHNNKATAHALHVQANGFLNQKHYLSSFESFMRAVNLYAKCGDEVNLQRAMMIATESCLPKLDRSIFDAGFEIEACVNTMTESIDALSENNRYKDLLTKFNIQYQKVKNRDKVSTN